VDGVVAPGRIGGQQTLVSLSCIDDDSQGTTIDVLWEREIDAEVIQESAWTDLGQRGFDPPQCCGITVGIIVYHWRLFRFVSAAVLNSHQRANFSFVPPKLRRLRYAERSSYQGTSSFA
jgi:hypothetical protein